MGLGVLLVLLVPCTAALKTEEMLPRNSFVVLPFAPDLPAGWETTAVVVVFQSLVELFGMVFYLWWLPRHPFRPETADSGGRRMISHHRACPVCQAADCTHFMQVDAYDYWRCHHCEATFVDPSQLPSRSAEHAEYRLHCNGVNDTGYRQFLARLASPLLERLSAGLSGLDYGCGPGPALAAMLTEAGHRMAVYDPLFFDDPKALDGRYDFITCTEVAEHFHRPFDEFARLDRLLKPGGWLAVMTRFQTDDAAFVRWHYRRDRTHVVFYREKTFRTIAACHRWRCEIPGADVALLHKPAF